jgi:class 3 adenylate cyclase/predicted ATPase
MQCSQCGAVSPAGNKFCGECGAPLAVECSACGRVNPPGTKFCGECGTALPAPSTVQGSDRGGTKPLSVALSAELPPVSAPVAERRVCSVLFCDLVGFTALSEARDPEEVRELLSHYFEVARTIVGRYGGVVEKFIGDAVMAVWGTPTAAEGDAERAVRAGLDLVEAVALLGAEARAEGLSARAGVVTGSVAVTVGATGEGMVAGDAVNTAARVQAAAKPGSVYVDEGTWLVARAAVAFAPAGEHLVKGKARPIALWQAGRVLSGVGGAQRPDGLEAPFLGRDPELRLVKDLFHACADRRAPRLVSVTGVAGVGKSRLGWEFEKYVDGLADSVLWHRGRCLSYGDGVAFWALAETVRQRFGIAEEDRTAVAAEKLATGLEQWFDDTTERAYISARLGQLLDVLPSADGRSLPREELFAGWRLFVERLALTAPVVLLVEDLQYADPGLLDFLEHLLDWARDVPIFILTLSRPELQERRPGWAAGRRNGITLSLDALDAEAMDALLDGLVPGMPVAAKTAIARRSEGIPLYAVETVRMLIDRDVVRPEGGVYRLVGDVGELGVPATLQSLLAARLDALEPAARSLVSDAAVLGSSFPADALVAVSGQPESDVRRQLSELLQREVLAVRADPLSPEQGQYGFVQTMLRQVAYETLSRRERKARHLAVAAYLESTFANSGDEIAEVIASHLLDALHAVPDDPDVAAIRHRAVTLLRRAGERAERAGAPAAAADAYSTAAELLQQVGDPEAELSTAELLEQSGHSAGIAGDPHLAVSRYHAAIEIYTRYGRVRDAARVMTRQAQEFRVVGQPEQGYAILVGALAVLRSEPDADTVKALEVLAVLESLMGNRAAADLASAEALALAQDLDLPAATLSQLFVTRGIGHGFAGHPAQALANLREALRLAEAAMDGTAATRALLNLADTMMTTDPVEATQTCRTAVAQARRLGDRNMLSYAACNLMQALLLTGGWDEIEEAYSSAASREAPDEDPTLAFGVVLLRSFRRDSDGMPELLSTMKRWRDTEDPQDASEAATALAAAAVSAGEAAQGLELARAALSHAETLSFRHDGIRWAWAIAADAALALNDKPEVERLVGVLAGHPPGRIPPVLRAEASRIRARLLASERDGEAASAFQAAVQAFRELGSPYHLAVGLVDQAEHSAGIGDLPLARQLAVEAEAISVRLGAEPLAERAQSVVKSALEPADPGQLMGSGRP